MKDTVSESRGRLYEHTGAKRERLYRDRCVEKRKTGKESGREEIGMGREMEQIERHTERQRREIGRATGRVKKTRDMQVERQVEEKPDLADSERGETNRPIKAERKLTDGEERKKRTAEHWITACQSLLIHLFSLLAFYLSRFRSLALASRPSPIPPPPTLGTNANTSNNHYVNDAVNHYANAMLTPLYPAVRAEEKVASSHCAGPYPYCAVCSHLPLCFPAVVPPLEGLKICAPLTDQQVNSQDPFLIPTFFRFFW